jgi:hypothetical protein
MGTFALQVVCPYGTIGMLTGRSEEPDREIKLKSSSFMRWIAAQQMPAYVTGVKLVVEV